jgi:hypothetical protein
LYYQKYNFNHAIQYFNDAILANNQMFDNFHMADNYLERAKSYLRLSYFANEKEDAVNAIAYAEDSQNSIILINSLNFLAEIAINFEEYAQYNSLRKRDLQIKKTDFLIKRENEIKLFNLTLQQQFNQNIKQKEELEDLNHLKTSFFLLFLMIYTDSFYHKKEY